MWMRRFGALVLALGAARATAHASPADSEATAPCAALATNVLRSPDTVGKTALASCLADHGKLTEADDVWQDLAASAPEPEAKASAAAHHAALAPRIPHCVISVLGIPPADLVILVDGAIVDPALGAAVPIDPGPLVVIARAADRVEWRALFQVIERQNINVRVPPLEPVPKVAAPAEPAATFAAAATPTLPAEPGALEDNSAAHDRQQRIALAIAAGGAVMLVVGAELGDRASSQWNAAKAACSDTGGSIASCPGTAFPVAQRDESSAHTNSILATTSFVLAGGLLATGGVLFALAPPELVRVSSRVTPTVSATGAGLAFTGRW